MPGPIWMAADGGQKGANGSISGNGIVKGLDRSEPVAPVRYCDELATRFHFCRAQLHVVVTLVVARPDVKAGPLDGCSVYRSDYPGVKAGLTNNAFGQVAAHGAFGGAFPVVGAKHGLLSRFGRKAVIDG